MTGSDSTTKTVAVTASSLQTGGTRKKRKSSAYGETAAGSERQTRKERKGPAIVSKEGGKQEGGTSPGTLVSLAANRAYTSPNAPPPKPSNASNLSKAAANSTPAPVSNETAIVSGGSTAKSQEANVKVILGEKKKKGTKVILSPTKVRKIPGISTGSAPVNKTRKVAKKIRMSLGGFGKRVTRANTIRHEAKKQKIEDVKKTLVEAKLVKADSKAPESVLRQMYADYMTLKSRAL